MAYIILKWFIRMFKMMIKIWERKVTNSKIKCPYKVNSNLQLSMNKRMKKKKTKKCYYLNAQAHANCVKIMK